MARKGSEGAGDPRKPATRVRAGTLAAALRDVKDAVAGKDTVPILGHVLIDVGDGTISLTATDLDMWATRQLASDDRDGPASKEWIESVRPFTLALPAKALGAIIGGFDGDAMVTITAPGGEESRATISAERSRFRLACLPVADFPDVPHFDVAHAFELPASRLADSFETVRHAVSTEETRYYLNGIYVHPEGLSLRMAATDGHKLSRLIQDVPDGAASLTPLIVARRVVALVTGLAAGAAKAREGATVLVEVSSCGLKSRWAMPAADEGEVTVFAKSVDGTFPDYDRVIPSDVDRRVTIAREPLAEAIKRVMAIAPKSSRCVKAEFTDSLARLSLTNADLGDASEELPCVLAGEPITIGFNGEYWRELLGAIATDEVTIGMNDPGAPAAIMAAESDEISSARVVHVLMPMAV
jgi:DNA polymerase-3 subunit beta